MNSMSPWNPVQDIRTLQSTFDRYFDLWNSPLDLLSSARTFEMDVWEDDQQYTVEASLPGFNANDIKVEAQNGILTISAEAQRIQNRRPQIEERFYGRYARSLRLPQAVNVDRAEAIYENGVLKLTLPKMNTSRGILPVRQTVKVSSEAQPRKLLSQIKRSLAKLLPKQAPSQQKYA
jgi:HSP20 family protein